VAAHAQKYYEETDTARYAIELQIHEDGQGFLAVAVWKDAANVSSSLLGSVALDLTLTKLLTSWLPTQRWCLNGFTRSDEYYVRDRGYLPMSLIAVADQIEELRITGTCK
jgi:hypothetical protein